MHCELYPNNAPIKLEIATELKYVLLHAYAGELFLVVDHTGWLNWELCIDFLTSDTSVVPYDLPKLQSMLDLTSHVVGYVAPQSSPPGPPLPSTSSGDTVELPAHLMCVLGAVCTTSSAVFHLHMRSSPYATVR